MARVIIAPIGEQLDNLFVGLRDFPADRVILLGDESEAKQALSDLERFKIPTRVVAMEGDMWESLFEKISQIKAVEEGNELIVNTATANPMMQCAATSAAFVNGLKAISVDGGEVMLLPVLKFSYYALLTDKKMRILKEVAEESCCASLEELSKRLNMSLPLVSYHVNGNLKSEGLKELGLAETHNHKGKTSIAITTMGKLLLKGYISSPDS